MLNLGVGSVDVGVSWVDVGIHTLYTGGGSGDGLGGVGQDTSQGRGGGCGVDGAEVHSTRLLPGGVWSSVVR